MPMRIFFRITVAALVVALISGCALGQYGQQYDEAYIQHIRKGKTTKENILSNLGEPGRRGVVNGAEVWSYFHYGEDNLAKNLLATFKHGYGLAPVTVNAKTLDITFRGNVVKDFSYTTTN